jgi:hypothetical protein
LLQWVILALEWSQVDCSKLTRNLGIIYIDKFRDIIMVSVASACIAPCAMIQSIVNVWGMVIAIVGQLVFVAEAAQPYELPERCESVFVPPILHDDRFAFLGHIAEHNRDGNPLNNIYAYERVKHERVHRATPVKCSLIDLFDQTSY